jgi:hypothetical protein
LELKQLTATLSEIDNNYACPYLILAICMRRRVDTTLAWKCHIPAEVPKKAEQRFDAMFLEMIFCVLLESRSKAGPNYPNNACNPVAVLDFSLTD